MEILSRHVADVAGGVELHTTLDGESISAYVVTGVNDLNAIADIVPPEKVEGGADIHAANVDNVDNAQDQIDQVLESRRRGGFPLLGRRGFQRGARFVGFTYRRVSLAANQSASPNDV